MRKFLFASHGKLASGLKSSLDVLAGNRDDITTIDAYGEDGEPDERIIDYFNQVSPEDEVYVLVDLSFGSVGQKIIPYASNNVHIISGMNLPLALQLILATEAIDLQVIIDEAKGGISYVNELMMQTLLDDDDE